MALQKDTFPMSLSSGVNEKIDPKVLGPDQMTSLKDVVIDKDGRCQKRFGQSVKSTTVQTSFPNPLTITTSSSKTKVFEHEDQLCMQNNGALYSQISGQDKWNFKGHCLPVGVSLQPVQARTAFTDIASVSGVTVTAGAGFVYVKEDATGSTLSITAVTNVLRLVAFSNAIWVLWASGTDLKAQQVSLVTGALGSAIILRSDLGTTAAKSVSVAVTSSSSLVGEAAFIAYKSTGNVKLVPMDASGATPALGVLDTGTTVSACLSIYIEPTLSANKLYMAFVGANLYAAAWTFSASAYTNVYGPTSVYTGPTSSTTTLRLASMAINPINNTEMYLFFDTDVTTPPTVVSPASLTLGAATDSLDSSLYYLVMSLTGSVTTSATVYGLGYQLAGTPVRDTSRGTIYLACIYWSQLQSTLILVDVLKGKSAVTTFVAAKCLYGLATQASVLSKLRLVSGSSTKYRMTNNGYAIDFELAPANAVSHQYIAKTTHLTGGLLWAYDGDVIAEHGFLFTPDRVQVWTGQDTYITLAISQVGDASHKETFTLTVGPANAFRGSVGTFNAELRSVQFNTVSVGNKYLWFQVDGQGFDPAPGGRTGILVSLLSTDTANEVALKIAIAMNTGNGYQVSTAGANVVTFTSDTNGAVSAPTRQGFAPLAGSLAAGSYQWTVVWKWTDRNGNIYRSAPAIAQTATALAGDTASVLVWCPPVSNKTITDVHVEIYRTQVNSTEFQLLSSTPVWSASASRIAYQDLASDASINANEILYTNGGVLDNFNIGACTAISAFKNRLIVTSVDDQTASFYSRTNINGEPVNFSEFNMIRLDQDGQAVTAHAQMDDKLVMFKADAPFVTAGDGSNDLGQGESFQLPLRIPGDFGTTNPNSLLLSSAGLVFQTPTKGIQVLTRGLSVEYIGAPVDDYKNNVVSGVVLTTNYENAIFSLSDSTTSLVYNYRLNRWDFFTNQQGDSSCLWKGAYVRAKNNGKVYVESSLYYDVDSSNLPISQYLETAWVKVKNIQSFARFYSAMLLGEYLSPHTLTIQIAFDFDPTVANWETHTFNATTVIGGGGTAPDAQSYQIEIQPARQKCNAIKIMITETPGTGSQASAYFNVLDFYVGLKRGTNRVKADKGI